MSTRQLGTILAAAQLFMNALVIVPTTFATPIPDPCFEPRFSTKVLGFHRGNRPWSDNPTKIPWTQLTNLSYFAVDAQPNGSLQYFDDFTPSTFGQLADAGDQFCVKVSLTLIVANPPNTHDPDGCVLRTRIHDVLDPSNHPRLINNIMVLLNQARADGVDVDIEFPSPPSAVPGEVCTIYPQDAQNYLDFVT